MLLCINICLLAPWRNKELVYVSSLLMLICYLFILDVDLGNLLCF